MLRGLTAKPPLITARLRIEKQTGPMAIPALREHCIMTVHIVRLPGLVTLVQRSTPITFGMPAKKATMKFQAKPVHQMRLTRLLVAVLPLSGVAGPTIFHSWGLAYDMLPGGPVEKACEGQGRKGREKVDRKQQPPDEELVPPRLDNQLIADEGSQNRCDELDAHKESRCCRSLIQAECIVQCQGHAHASQEEAAQALITTGQDVVRLKQGFDEISVFRLPS